MIQALLDSAFTRVRLVPVRMAFSDRLDDVGRFSLRKLARLPGLAFRLILARLQGATVLYYPPAGPGRVPFLRDLLLLSAVRWIFPKTVYHFHSAGLAARIAALGRLGRGWVRLAYGRPTLAILVSQHAPADADPLRPHAVRAIPNGIPDPPDPATFRAPPGETAAVPVILYLGAVTREKGIDVLIEALRQLRARHRAFRAVLAGPIPSPGYGQRLRLALSADGLAGCVSLPGALEGDAKWRALANADLFCFPSLTDVFGLVALEAMAMRVPIVGSDAGGLREMVEHGVTGLRVPPGDPVALADGLERLLDDPGRRRTMGDAGYARFRSRFTLAHWRSAMEDALAEAAADREHAS